MPTTQHTINLIRTKTIVSPEVEAIESSLKKASMITLAVFICISVVVGSTYLLFYYKLNNEETQKKNLITRINSLKNKEAYLLAIKDRTKTVEKAMSNQKPWVQMLDLVNTFATPPALTSISVDEQDKIALTVKTKSLEDILHIAESIITNVNSKRIKNPQLVSFQVLKEGDFEISISFYALFNPI